MNIHYYIEYFIKYAGKLTNPSKLRNVAVFFMGAPGAGKSTTAERWLKYMPEQPQATEKDRGLSDLNFDSIINVLLQRGYRIEPVNDSSAKIPYVLYEEYEPNQYRQIKKEDYKDKLSSEVYDKVKDLEHIIFSTPKHELPSYWRQVNPDIYKEEIPGYEQTKPQNTHYMSYLMSGAYYEAILRSGDPVVVDGTGANLDVMTRRINLAKENGYNVSLVYVYVPLTISHIRNIKRARNVNPNFISSNFHLIGDNFDKLSNIVDKHKVIINTNDESDFEYYKANKFKVNEFIRENTSYDSLYELISNEADNEISLYGELLK